MPKLTQSFLDRIKQQTLDRIEQRVKRELSPEIKAPPEPTRSRTPAAPGQGIEPQLPPGMVPASPGGQPQMDPRVLEERFPLDDTEDAGRPGDRPKSRSPLEDASSPDKDEGLLPSLSRRIKEKVRERLQDSAPVRNRMLDPSAELDDATIRYRIRYAGKNNLLLLMTYNGQTRHVEPYSYRARAKGGGLLFYGYCRIHDKIHAFKPSKIQGLVVTQEPFAPRWPVELG